jgi:hypothetical protein
MNNNKFLSTAVVIACVLFITGCENSEGDATVSYQRQLRADAKCYFGATGNFDSCLNVNTIEEVQKVSSQYNYLNPTTANLPVGFNPENYRPPLHLADTKGAPNFKLVEFFTLNELMPNSRNRWGLISSVALDIFNSVRKAVNTPITVNSAYRSPGRNSNTEGSATWSRHMYGDAFDFYSPKKSLRDLKKYCQRFGASFIQVYSTHIHCDWRDSLKDPDFFGPDQVLPPAVSVDRILQDLAKLELWTEENLFFAQVNNLVKEDEGQLEYLWKLTTPNGEVIEQSNESFEYNLVSEGLYHIQVEVGGHIQLEQSFEWSHHEH